MFKRFSGAVNKFRKNGKMVAG